MNIVVIGGGAAGFFAAIRAKEVHPGAEVILLEQSMKVLSKVKISGGGRCNVTHACFEPKELVKHYPRGHKELLGPFHQFGPSDTVEWFESRGVKLKTEKDGRMFPVSNSSETIIQCLVGAAEKVGVDVRLKHKVRGIEKGFKVLLKEGSLEADKLIVATGSSKEVWEFIQELGHTIVKPYPSLFTFNIPQFSLLDIAGVSVPNARISLKDAKLFQEGPLLITHWGFSGPAALKLSAWGARYLAEVGYQAEVTIDWAPSFDLMPLLEGSKQVGNLKVGELPKSLWSTLVKRLDIDLETPVKQLGKKKAQKLSEALHQDRYAVRGKTTNKEEFVTAGGIKLSEVNFKTMESKLCPGLHFAGEVLNIDGVTGGFNFQNAWTTGYLAGT